MLRGSWWSAALWLVVWSVLWLYTRDWLGDQSWWWLTLVAYNCCFGLLVCRTFIMLFCRRRSL